MKNRLNVNMIFLMFVAGLVLTGCNFDSTEGSGTDTKTPNSSKADKEEAVEQVLNITETSEIPTMDSVHAHDNVAFTVLGNVNEGLYRLGKDHKPELAMASDHKVSEDGLTYTFTLRDAKWSNGEPVTADDFVYAWQRVFKDTGYYASMFVTAKILNAEEILNGEKAAEELGIKALDEQTLEVTLSGSNPLLLQNLTFPSFLPQNQEFVEGQADQYALEANNLLFNGPFMLSEWKHDESWQYEKNPDYWDADNVKLEEINVVVVKEDATGLNLYETGEVDMIRLSSASVDQFRDDEDISFIEDSEIFFLRFNHNHEAFGNENIRRAIDMGWDKKAHAEVILNNGSLPLYGLVPRSFSSSPEGTDFRELAGDYDKGTIEEAQQYFSKGLEEIGKDSIDITLTASDVESNDKTAEYLKNQLEKNLPGLSIDIKIVPPEQRYELETAVDYDMVISAWGPDYIDPMTFIGMWVTDGGANRMDYSNPDYDALVDDANNENDLSKRYQTLLDAEEMLFEDAAIGPLYQRGQAVLQQAKIKGLVRHPSGADFTFKWAYIDGGK